ncbi:MAG TPA: hypothetical protein VMZ74_11535 [Ramlibacter sp.]|nr:hypothetical protein [Ramlibacter sp.]
MPYQVKYRPQHDYVFAEIVGEPSIDEFLAALQEIGAASVAWTQRCVVVDLRPVRREYSFTEQLRIGQAVARNFGHLEKAAAIVQAERITRVGEKAAHHSGAKEVSVFTSEADAADWIRGGA